MYSGVARSSYRQHSCDDVTKMGLCDWFTNELKGLKEEGKGSLMRELVSTCGTPIPNIKNESSLIRLGNQAFVTIPPCLK